METPSAKLTREITELIAERLLVEMASPDDDLLVSGVLDSLTLVQLLLDLEQRFDVTIPLEELEIDDFRSIASIVRLVQSRATRLHSGTSVMSDDPLVGAAEQKSSQARHAYAMPVLGGDPGQS